MTHFKVVSVGWNCADWFEQTLGSVERQSTDDWEVFVVYDKSPDDGAERIAKWCDARDERWHYQLNTNQYNAVKNQYDAIHAMDPADDDVVVFLDLDGDMLANEDSLKTLASHYEDDTLVTYGSYAPIPASEPTMPIEPFPDSVVRDRSYRRHMLTKGCCINHLRTMKGKIAKAIPVSELQWNKGPNRGEFYERGTDYIFMMTGLELANGRYKCVRDVLMYYNHANPHSDNLRFAGVENIGVLDFMCRPPLPPLEQL